MILFKFKEKYNNHPDLENNVSPISVIGYRWVAELSADFNQWAGISLGFYHQYCPVGEGKWHHAGRYYDVSVTPHWSFGRHHTYYDGPHDSFSLGFLHFNWSGDWCAKCVAGD